MAVSKETLDQAQIQLLALIKQQEFCTTIFLISQLRKYIILPLIR